MASPAPTQTPNDTHGLNGFAFVEFTGPDTAAMERQLTQLGFTAVSHHPGGDVVRFQQGDVTFLLNRGGTPQARDFAQDHGPSANAMAFAVRNPAESHRLAVEHGAKPADAGAGVLGPDAHVLQGIGGSYLYLVESGADPFSGWTPMDHGPTEGVGLHTLDHLTHNVRRGQMRVWSSFYGDVFGFTEQKYFDIKGKATGLFSQAMVAPDGMIRIPLNESQDEASQIEEFLREYNGEGIQHIALATENIYDTVEALRDRGVQLQDTIETYYELVDTRLPGHGEDMERMKRNRILIDGSDEEGTLLQIFTEPTFGPVFFEIIQRKGNQAFGEGNFQALFESIELDQIRRGVIEVDA